MPTLVFFLARMGVVTGRFLLKYFKYAFLVIFIVAAVVSPGTDMMSQLIMAVPMLGALHHQHRDRVHLPEAPQARNRTETAGTVRVTHPL